MSQNARSAVSPQDSFIDKYADFAIAVSEVSGIAPEVVLGQTALETAWGKSVAGNNMFGVKGAGQSVVTHEDIPGVGMVKVTDSFRAYNNPLESFMDYGKLMDNARYGHIGTNQTVAEQIASIGKSGYATDRNYGKKLSSVVDRIQESRIFQDKVVNNVASYTPTADPFLGDVGIPLGRIESSPVPDITPATSAGFSLDGFTPAEQAPVNLSDAVPDFSSITAGTAFDPNVAGFSGFDVGSYAQAPAPMDKATVNDVFDSGFPEQKAGFSAGFDAGPFGQTPDFNAPSLEDRNALDRFEGVMAVQNNTAPDLSNEAIAERLMRELSPQTPQAPIAPASVSSPQVTASSTPPMGDYDPFSTGFQAPTTAQPQVSTRAPSTTASTAPKQEQIASTYDLPSFDLPSVDLPSVPTVRDIGSTLGLMDKVDTGFMNAMASPDIAKDWSPGILDGWTGKALAGAARGALTGGPLGAAMGGLWGGLGISDRLASEWDRYANAYANLTPEDFRAFGLDGNWTDREPTMNTGMFGGYDGRGGGRVGDGSYSEYSGRNDNNPQGIL